LEDPDITVVDVDSSRNTYTSEYLKFLEFQRMEKARQKEELAD
jgi:hypothetical protein